MEFHHEKNSSTSLMCLDYNPKQNIKLNPEKNGYCSEYHLNNSRKSNKEHPKWGWMDDFKILKQYLLIITNFSYYNK